MQSLNRSFRQPRGTRPPLLPFPSICTGVARANAGKGFLPLKGGEE